MPLTRCLSCGELIDSKLSRHPKCAKAVKDERNRQAALLGPCPQDGACGICAGFHGPASVDDPFVWHHAPKRFIDGGKTVIPAHKSCNERLKRTDATKPHS